MNSQTFPAAAVRPVGLGVIGCGRIGGAHLRAAADLAAEARLVGLADVTAPRELASRLGVGFATDDYRRLLERPDVDAVLVATPTDTHARIVGDAIAAGKHVLVEKPVTLDAASAATLVEAAERAGVTLMVAQSRRFPPAVSELVRRLPEIGPRFRLHIQLLVSFPAPPTEWWKSAKRSRGLVIPLQGSHSLDSVVWWKGVPEWVFATGSRRNPAWEGEDEADILCRFADGAVASVHLSLSTEPPVHEWLLVGGKGTLRLVEEPNGAPFGFRFRLEQNGATVFEDPDGQPYRHQLAEFLAALREGRTPLANGRSVLATMRTLDAAIESLASGKPVAPAPK